MELEGGLIEHTLRTSSWHLHDKHAATVSSSSDNLQDVSAARVLPYACDLQDVARASWYYVGNFFLELETCQTLLILCR